jgi:hypothetical protein
MLDYVQTFDVIANELGRSFVFGQYDVSIVAFVLAFGI